MRLAASARRNACSARRRSVMSVATPTTPEMEPFRPRTGEYCASNSNPNNSTRAVTDSPAKARRTSATACGTSPSSSKNDLPMSIPGRTPSEWSPLPSASVKTPFGSSENRMTGEPATTVRRRCLLVRRISS